MPPRGRKGAALPLALPRRFDARVALRMAAGFAAGLALWLVFAPAYERAVAAGAGVLLRLVEHPSVTTLGASGGEFRVDRSDFPPASPRPGLPAADLHFNFVLLTTLFAISPHPLAPGRFGRFWLAALLLYGIHVVALAFQVEALYATRLGPWSEAHYGAVARNLWAGGFHFYQVAGRFAAPFALWWALSAPPMPDA